jgi:outer membrane protein assembly factor BamB
MAILGLFMLAVLGGAGWFAWSVWVANEGRLRDQARRDYQEGRFVEAAGKFRTLAEKFPESTDLPEYQFLAALSELRGAMQGVGVNPAEQMERAAQFLNRHAPSPLLKQYGPDLGQSLVRLLNDLAAGAAQSGKADDRAALDRAEQLLAEMEQRAPGNVSAGDRGKLAEAFAAARGAIEQRERQQQFLDRLHALAATPSADAVKEAHRLIQRESAQQPGVERDPAVQQALAQLYEGHRGRVVYIPAGIDVDQKGRRAEAVEPSLLVDPLVAGYPGAMAGEDRTILALARGVLYALSRNTGQVQWAMRVGIDTEELPLRVPPTLANPEMFLVLSADSNTLTALDADGVQLWQYPLTAPCLGRPVVVDQRAFVPTYDGQVHEIELVRGHLLGRYNLGQRLSVGGARQPGTHLLYFPADDYCVYVLNVDPKLPPQQRRCEAVLYSRHPSGSLRSEPILAAWENPAGPAQGYLILPRAQGLDAVELQTYGLPLGAPDARPLPMEPAPRVRGWTWFPPYHDPEKLALATDAGMFDLFGIRQLRNQDAPLFHVLHEEVRAATVRERPALPLPDGRGSSSLQRRGRSQVVHVQENDFWVLAQGRLQRLRLTFDRQKGPHVVAVWEQAVPLGSPLHVSQVDETPEASLGLLVVTQALGRQTCLATMVDAEDGRIRWQRQLGLVCQGDPLCLGHEVLAVDQGGGLFRFDPDRHPHLTNRPWQIGGANVARPLESRDRQGAAGTSRPYLLPAPDGKSAYEIAPTGKGTSLAVRHYSLGGEAKQVALDEHVIELRAALAGPPALAGDALLLPLADGSLHRLHLPLDGSAGVDGPDWRTSRSLAELRPFVVGLGPDEFLTSDGIGGLTRWRWPRGDVWQALPKNKDPRCPTLELPARIVSAPVVLPADGKGEQRICTADAEGTVYLLQTKGDALEVARRWRASNGSAATAGPFVRDGKIGCIVERKRLVWIDPAEERPVWEYRADEEIVGQPQLVDGLLVLADQSGKFVALDPATGRPRGPGYRLRANVAPAASPVAFGDGRAFAPLTDGTVFLLPLDRLGDPLRGFPLFW